jgi:hypothetical protein
MRMRKGLAYLELAESCRELARRMDKPVHKKQLEIIARACERMARDRAKQLAKTAKSKRARKLK